MRKVYSYFSTYRNSFRYIIQLLRIHVSPRDSTPDPAVLDFPNFFAIPSRIDCPLILGNRLTRCPELDSTEKNAEPWPNRSWNDVDGPPAMSSVNDNASSPLAGDGVSKRKQGKSSVT
jgi:hypothetical protein